MFTVNNKKYLSKMFTLSIKNKTNELNLIQRCFLMAHPSSVLFNLFLSCGTLPWLLNDLIAPLVTIYWWKGVKFTPELFQGTQGCHGTTVENHCSRWMRPSIGHFWQLMDDGLLFCKVVLMMNSKQIRSRSLWEEEKLWLWLKLSNYVWWWRDGANAINQI